MLSPKLEFDDVDLDDELDPAMKEEIDRCNNVLLHYVVCCDLYVSMGSALWKLSSYFSLRLLCTSCSMKQIFCFIW